MNKLVSEMKKAGAGPPVRLFTLESLQKITKRIAEDAAREKQQQEEVKSQKPSAAAAAALAHASKKKDLARKQHPSSALEQAKRFPEKLGDFPPELFGKPIEDLDDFYSNKYVSELV